MNRSTIRAITCLVTLPVVLLLFGFADTEPRQQKVLMVEMPLYLEEHLDAALIEGSKVPEDFLEPVEWGFDQAQPDWKPLKPIPAQVEAVNPSGPHKKSPFPRASKRQNSSKSHLFQELKNTLIFR